MSEDSFQDTVTRDAFEKVKAESIARKEKLRDLEGQLAEFQTLKQQVTNIRVENELLRRGVNAEPDWVRVPENNNVTEAVDQFVAKYPHLLTTTTPTEPDPVEEFAPAPQPLSVNRTNPHTPGPPAQGSLPSWATKEGLDAIQKDPKSKRQLQEWYREQLTSP